MVGSLNIIFAVLELGMHGITSFDKIYITIIVKIIHKLPINKKQNAITGMHVGEPKVTASSFICKLISDITVYCENKVISLDYLKFH